jgi:hypothetical protein
MDDDSYFMVDGNEWYQQSYYESEDHPATEDVKFIRKTKFPAKVLLLLVASESGSTYSNVYQYFKNSTKTKKSSSALIWRLHTTQL